MSKKLIKSAKKIMLIDGEYISTLGIFDFIEENKDEIGIDLKGNYEYISDLVERYLFSSNLNLINYNSELPKNRNQLLYWDNLTGNNVNFFLTKNQIEEIFFNKRTKLLCNTLINRIVNDRDYLLRLTFSKEKWWVI